MALIPYFARIQFDFGARRLLAEELAALGVRRPLVVTDRGVVSAGVLQRALESIASLAPPVFSDVAPDPHLAVAEAAASLYARERCDCIIAVGGGAAIDTAKAVALVVSHEGPLEQYRTDAGGAARIGPQIAPLVAIATTAGTGSDIGRGLGISRVPGNPKMVLASVHLIPKVAICDPELTLGLPAQVTAGTGIDAFSHAFEAFLSPAVNPPVDAIALDAMARLWSHLPAAVSRGADRAARWEVMMGATESGMCFWKGLGPAHALSIPLDTLGLHHGTLVGVLLPATVRFLGDAVPDKLVRLRAALGLGRDADLGTELSAFNRRIGLPGGLREMGVKAADLPGAAAAASAGFFNQSSARRGTAGDYLALAQDAFG